MGIGAVTLAIAVLGVLAWLAFLLRAGRIRRQRKAAAPHNMAPFMSDAELEGYRLNGVLASALIATVVLAIILPIYYLAESDRQAAAAERFDEIAVERGEHWYEEFQCGDCHGPAGGGGGAEYVEARSGLPTSWAAPALDDMLYRYSEDEVLYWLVWGRQGSPMPAWGTEGGGPLNTQQLDELVAYLDHIQVTQADAVAGVDARVDREITRLANADATLDAAIEAQEAEIADLEAAPGQLAEVGGLADEAVALFTAPGTCTDESAALVAEPCTDEGSDADRDGLSDGAESGLNDLIAAMVAGAPPSDARRAVEGISFDPATPFSVFDGAEPIADLDSAGTVLAEFETIVRDLNLAVDNQDRLMETAESGLAFLVEAREARRYAIDFDSVAAAEFDGKIADAQRGAALYNAYCARCHTAGYSAGIPFTQEAGSGALGPSLRDGRSVVQFPDPADHYEFIVMGSENGQGYGVNGIGRGWMPGFGSMLGQEDIMLIVLFERAL
jgi:mono/diheme cytochrome c family protein